MSRFENAMNIDTFVLRKYIIKLGPENLTSEPFGPVYIFKKNQSASISGDPKDPQRSALS